MIAGLLPAFTATVEAHANGLAHDLLAQEAQLVGRVVEKRRREFAAGRACAREALGKLGWPQFPILAGQAREPLWPPGVVGSITHCAGYCAASVARSIELRSLGIDAEVNAPLPDGVEEMVCTEQERQRFAAVLPGLNWSTVIFSAKESVYKAWYPLSRRWLGPLDAELSFDPAGGQFTVHIVTPQLALAGDLPSSFIGRFAVTREHVFTTVIVPVIDAAPR